MSRARERMARELNDLVGRVVASTALVLDSCARRAPADDPALRLRLEQARADADRTAERIGDLLNGLNLGDPAGPGLPARVKHLIKDERALTELRAAFHIEQPSQPPVASSRDGQADQPLRLNDVDISIVQLLAQGLSNKQIGARVGLSPYTVKDHLKRIASGLSVRGRTAIVAEALRRGLV